MFYKLFIAGVLIIALVLVIWLDSSWLVALMIASVFLLNMVDFINEKMKKK